MESVTALELESFNFDDPQEVPVERLSFSENKLDIFCGFVGGVAGIVAGHSFDTIRIRMQTAPSKQGTFTRLFATIRHEGGLSLFRGITPPLVASGFQNALLFATYAPSVRWLADPKSTCHVSSPLGRAFLAGCVAGGLQTFITTPTELIKVRMQSSGSRFAGSMECLVASLRSGGLRQGFFKGFGVTFLRDCPNIGIYFASYEWCKKMLRADTRQDGAQDGHGSILLAGGIAGMLSWTLAYPMDVLKTRYQADVSGVYRSVRDTLRVSVRAHGWGILFQGFSACMYRAFVVNAATFFAYEEARRRLAPDTLPAVH